MQTIAVDTEPQKPVPEPIEEITLKRDLGVLGSFSIGFADVGADIYVALGLVLFVWFMGTYRLSNEDPTIILGDLYNYGALVSFMLVNLSLIRLRNRRPELYRPYRSPLALRLKWKGKDVEFPVLPALGFFVCLFVWILVLSLHQIGKIVGTLWFIVGIILYLWYRRRLGLSWKTPIPGTLATEPHVAHELHPEIAEELKSGEIKK